MTKTLPTFLLISFLLSCSTQPHTNSEESQYSPENSVPTIPCPEKGFYCGYKDSKGNLWFGSRGNGVFKYDGEAFSSYTTENGLCDNDISSILEDKNGNLWLGTTSGVCKFDGTAFSALNVPYSDTSTVWLDKVYPVVNPNQVMSIYEDRDGDLWFGTNGAGVYEYNGSSFTQHLSDIGMHYEDSLQHNIVLRMTEDLEGNIWFSSLSHGGVSSYDGQQFTHYTSELSDDFIRDVFCDSKGNIWIGTHGNYNGGMDKFDGQNFTSYHKTNDGFRHNNVWQVYEDHAGLLWIGSGTTELSTFDGTHFTPFKDHQGKTYDEIVFLVGDNDNNIWFGNRFGLWMFDGEMVVKITNS